MARQRVGVFGGTFDPIHYGHLVAAEEVRVVCQLDKVVFMPAGTPPHKMGQTVSPAEHRLMMVDIAVQSNPYFECSDIDIRRAGALAFVVAINSRCGRQKFSRVRP